MQVSGRILKISFLFLFTLISVVWSRLHQHTWVLAFTLFPFTLWQVYTYWHREKALDERIRLARLQEQKAARRGKHGVRHFGA